MEQSIGNQFKDTKANATKTLNSFVAEEKAMAEKVNQNIDVDKIKSRLVKLKDQAGARIDDAGEFVKKHPVATVAAASAAGFLIARLLFKRRRD